MRNMVTTSLPQSPTTTSFDSVNSKPLLSVDPNRSLQSSSSHRSLVSDRSHSALRKLLNRGSNKKKDLVRSAAESQHASPAPYPSPSSSPTRPPALISVPEPTSADPYSNVISHDIQDQSAEKDEESVMQSNSFGEHNVSQNTGSKQDTMHDPAVTDLDTFLDSGDNDVMNTLESSYRTDSRKRDLSVPSSATGNGGQSNLNGASSENITSTMQGSIGTTDSGHKRKTEGANLISGNTGNLGSAYKARSSSEANHACEEKLFNKLSWESFYDVYRNCRLSDALIYAEPRKEAWMQYSSTHSTRNGLFDIWAIMALKVLLNGYVSLI